MNNESGPGGVKGSAGNSSSAAPARRMPLKVWGLGAVTVAIALVLAWPHWRGQPHSAATAASTAAAAKVPVRTVLVAQKDMPVVVTGIGSVVPAASVVIRTRVDGQLDQVAFKEGQDVKAGQVLARLDARTYQAQLQQVQAQKAKDEALLANAQADLQR